jgi:hypothetical protein
MTFVSSLEIAELGDTILQTGKKREKTTRITKYVH